MTNKKDVNVVVPEGEEPMLLTILTEHIVKLSNIGKQLNNSRLKGSTISLLLNRMTGVGMNDIKLILEALPELENKYLK